MSESEVLEVEEVVPAPAADLSSSLAIREPSSALPSYLPVPTEWAVILQQADVLASSDLVPSAYRKKPANVVVATLAGRPFGWDASMSMRSFHIIEGLPSMKPEIMLALIRQAGHSVRGQSSPEGATITGIRRDNADSMTSTFTLLDAERAGLCKIKDGAAFARSSSGKVLPWEQYPEAMCWARALSKLARMLFSDVVLGAGYVPEEFGSFVDDEGNVLDVGEAPDFARPSAAVVIVSEEEAESLRARANALPGAARLCLKGSLQEAEIFGFPADLPIPKLPIVRAMLDALEKRNAAGEWEESPRQADPVSRETVSPEEAVRSMSKPDVQSALEARGLSKTGDVATLRSRLLLALTVTVPDQEETEADRLLASLGDPALSSDERVAILDRLEVLEEETDPGEDDGSERQ